MGINPFAFTWNLVAGEEFQTPEVVMVYSNEDLGGISLTYHNNREFTEVGNEVTAPKYQKGIQYGTSLVYPASAMSTHVTESPNHQTGRTSSFETKGYSTDRRRAHGNRS